MPRRLLRLLVGGVVLGFGLSAATIALVFWLGWATR